MNFPAAAPKPPPQVSVGSLGTGPPLAPKPVSEPPKQAMSLAEMLAAKAQELKPAGAIEVKQNEKPKTLAEMLAEKAKELKPVPDPSEEKSLSIKEQEERLKQLLSTPEVRESFRKASARTKQ